MCARDAGEPPGPGLEVLLLLSAEYSPKRSRLPGPFRSLQVGCVLGGVDRGRMVSGTVFSQNECFQVVRLQPGRVPLFLGQSPGAGLEVCALHIINPVLFLKDRRLGASSFTYLSAYLL